MDIANLLAQGTRARPAGMEQNALMQAQEFKQRQAQNALMQMQMQAAQEKQAQDRQNALMQQQFINSIPSPQMQASQAALAGGGGPTVANAAQMKPVDPRTQMLHDAMRARMVSPVDYINAANPKDEFVTVAPGASRINARTNQVAFTAPDKSKEDAFVGLMKQAGIDPASPQGQAMLADRLRKESTHQPAPSFNNYGSPLPIQLPDGQTGYIQPPTRPGGPTQVLQVPGTGQAAVKPTDAKDKDLTEAQAKATTYLGQMRSASKALESLKMDQSALSVQAETALAGGAANIAIGAKAQQVRQSQDQWSEAFLRFKTGAASTPAEVAANRKTFFPVIGDKPEQVAQKKEMRAQAERDMEIPAGRGTKQLDSRQPQQAGGVVEWGALK